MAFKSSSQIRSAYDRSMGKRHHGNGWVAKRGPVYHAFWYEHGQRRQRSTKCTNRADAEKILDGILRNRGVGSNPGVTLGDAVSTLRADWRSRDVRSLSNLDLWTRRVVAYLGGPSASVGVATPSEVDRYIAKRIRDGAARNSVRAEIVTLKAAINVLIDRGELNERHRPRFKTPPIDRRAVRRGFVDAGTLALVAACMPTTHADFVTFLFYTGWRAGEARGLTWDAYDAAAREIRLTAGDTKEAKPRVIPVVGVVADVIDRRLALRTNRHVFTGRGHKPIGDIRKTLYRACSDAGVDRFILHDLRRSFVKMAADSGVPEATIMRVTGHRTMSVFRRYSIVTDDAVARGYDAIMARNAETPTKYHGRSGNDDGVA